MVGRRVRVARKRGGTGGVSITITLPVEVYEALGEPEEVIVDFDGERGVAVVAPARVVVRLRQRPGAPPGLAGLASGDPDAEAAASEVAARLRKRGEAAVVVLDCGRGVVAARYPDGSVVRLAIPKSAEHCREALRQVAVEYYGARGDLPDAYQGAVLIVEPAGGGRVLVYPA